MRILLTATGEERTVTDANVNKKNSNVEIQDDVMVGDEIRLMPVGRTKWSWGKVPVVVQSGEGAVDSKGRKKVKRKPFDVELLLDSPQGLSALLTHLPKLVPTRCTFTAGREASALRSLLSLYREWIFNLYPKLHFEVLMRKIERLGAHRRVRERMHELRYGRESTGVKRAKKDEEEEEEEEEGGKGEGEKEKKMREEAEEDEEMMREIERANASIGASSTPSVRLPPSVPDSDDDDEGEAEREMEVERKYDKKENRERGKEEGAETKKGEEEEEKSRLSL